MSKLIQVKDTAGSGIGKDTFVKLDKGQSVVMILRGSVLPVQLNAAGEIENAVYDETIDNYPPEAFGGIVMGTRHWFMNKSTANPSPWSVYCIADEVNADTGLLYGKEGCPGCQNADKQTQKDDVTYVFVVGVRSPETGEFSDKFVQFTKSAVAQLIKLLDTSFDNAESAGKLVNFSREAGGYGKYVVTQQSIVPKIFNKDALETFMKTDVELNPQDLFEHNATSVIKRLQDWGVIEAENDVPTPDIPATKNKFTK